MRRSRSQRTFRLRRLALASVTVIATSVAIVACVFGTKTNFCEREGIRCRESEVCAPNQPVCVPIGGCGNGTVDPGEACDDGNTKDGSDENGIFVLDNCSHDCTSNQRCGNGIIDRGEACDDGTQNGQPDSACDAACRIIDNLCGNGTIDPDKGEQCDPGMTDSPTCNSPGAGSALECKISKCGDGYINQAADEVCDSSGLDSASCNGKLCTAVACGDGYLNKAAGEQCESGGLDTSSCNGTGAASLNLACHLPSCGDGYTNTAFTPPGGLNTEECDNLGGGDTTGCNGNNTDKDGPGSCRTPACGDGYVNGATGEQCDPLGGADSDTCNGTAPSKASLRCKLASCGDGYTNRAFTPPGAIDPENCDNGASDSTGCNGNNGGKNGPGSCRMPACGDGYVNSATGETCDGGTTDDTADCNGIGAGSKRCHISICGDNHINMVAGEQCDNGSTDSGSCNGAGAGKVKCLIPVCGDGYVNKAAGEECEVDGDCNTGKTCQNCNCK